MVATGLKSRFEKSRAHMGQAPTYDYYLRVEDVDDGGEADTGEISGFVQDAVGKGVAGLAGLEYGLRVDEGGLEVGHGGRTAFLDKANGLFMHCGPRGQCLPAPLLTATAKRAIDHQLDVPNLSRSAPGSTNELAAGYYSRTDPRAEGDVCQVLRTQSEADPMFGYDGGVGIVLEGHGKA